jgi:hypothetical protein
MLRSRLCHDSPRRRDSRDVAASELAAWPSKIEALHAHCHLLGTVGYFS